MKDFLVKNKLWLVLAVVVILIGGVVWLNIEMYQAVQLSEDAAMKTSAFLPAAAQTINNQGSDIAQIVTYLNAQAAKK